MLKLGVTICFSQVALQSRKLISTRVSRTRREMIDRNIPELQKASSHVFVVCVGRIYDLTTGLLPSKSCRWVVGSGVVVGWATPR